MRKLTVSTFVTLDGVMQAPGGPGEDPSGGFAHEGWSVNYWDDLKGQVMGRFMSKPFDLLIGRKTYQIFAAYWPHVTDGSGDGLNSAKKHVASRTLKTVDWNNSTLITGDVSEYVAGLKDQEGPEIQVHGSGNLLQTLMKHDLIDEFQLLIFPILLGTGKRLFSEGTIPAGLKLVDTQSASTGVVIARYERAGDVKYGSFAPANPI
jgi:dihydrofolate reductase